MLVSCYKVLSHKLSLLISHIVYIRHRLIGASFRTPSSSVIPLRNPTISSHCVATLLFTVLTPQRPAQMLSSPLAGGDPGPIHPRRLMAHMLGVSTGQVRDPITHVVLMKPDNGLAHTRHDSATIPRHTSRCLFFQSVFIMQAAKDRTCHDAQALRMPEPVGLQRTGQCGGLLWNAWP
jgi:hypothetical protein